MKKSQVISICFLLVLVNPVAGDDKDYMDIVDKFFSILFIEGKPEEAIDYIYSSNEWMKRSQDAIDQIKGQIKELPSLVGQYHSHELIYQKRLGNHFVYLSYFVRYDRQPLRFEFRFYRPSNKWTTFSFGFDYEFANDFQDQARRETLLSE